jgi:hypothetical protein
LEVADGVPAVAGDAVTNVIGVDVHAGLAAALALLAETDLCPGECKGVKRGVADVLSMFPGETVGNGVSVVGHVLHSGVILNLHDVVPRGVTGALDAIFGSLGLDADLHGVDAAVVAVGPAADLVVAVGVIAHGVAGSPEVHGVVGVVGTNNAGVGAFAGDAPGRSGIAIVEAPVGATFSFGLARVKAAEGIGVLSGNGTTLTAEAGNHFLEPRFETLDMGEVVIRKAAADVFLLEGHAHHVAEFAASSGPLAEAYFRLNNVHVVEVGVSNVIRVFVPVAICDGDGRVGDVISGDIVFNFHYILPSSVVLAVEATFSGRFEFDLDVHGVHGAVMAAGPAADLHVAIAAHGVARSPVVDRVVGVVGTNDASVGATAGDALVDGIQAWKV